MLRLMRQIGDREVEAISTAPGSPSLSEEIPNESSLSSGRDAEDGSCRDEDVSPEEAGEVGVSAAGQETSAEILSSFTPGSPPDHDSGRGVHPKFDIVWHELDLSGLAVRIEQGPFVALATDGLEPPRMLGLGFPDGSTAVVDLQFVGGLSLLLDPLAKTQVVTHGTNGLASVVGRAAGRPEVFDTELAARLLDGGLHGVDPAMFEPGVVAAEFGVVAREQPDLGKYAATAKLSSMLVALRRALEARLQEDGLTGVAELEMKLVGEMAAMQRAGLRFDVQRWNQLVAARLEEAAGLQKKLADEHGLANPRAQNELLACLQKAGITAAGTSNDDLLAFEHPVVDLLLRYRRLDGFLQSIAGPITTALKESPDGRVRAQFDQLGCATGRITSRRPNLLGIPRDEEVRRCVIPDRGFVFLEGDYCAADLRVLAEITHDVRLKAVFAGGDDPHRMTASAVTGKRPSDVSDQERQAAKAISFGGAYGMGAASMLDYAAKSYGVTMSLGQAEQWIALFKKTYPGIAEWQERTRREMAAETRTLSGRIRRYRPEHGYPARLASPVQGTVADATKRAIVLAGPRLRELGARIVLSVHDSILCECPTETADACSTALSESMRQGMAEFVRCVPVEVKTQVKDTWAGGSLRASDAHPPQSSG